MSRSKVPSFLTPEVAATFGDPRVVASYRYRPTYPSQTFDILASLIPDDSRTVLDLGCGTGFLARPLAPLAERVDAVDTAPAMIAAGRTLPGGDHPHLQWIVGSAETVSLHPPYGLVTTGDSLHWMDWDVLLPRLAGILSSHASLAIVTLGNTIATEDEAIPDALVELIKRYTTFHEWRPDFGLVAELTHRGLFREEGRSETNPIIFSQPLDDYVESFHARASLSWERMDEASVAAFDAALRQLLRARVGAIIDLAVQAHVVWGKPLDPTGAGQS